MPLLHIWLSVAEALTDVRRFMRPRKKINQKDIAKVLGISNVSVSNALAGKKGVSEEMRQRILETARKMGYDISRSEKKTEERSVTLGIISSQRYMSEGTSFYWEMYQNTINAASGRNVLTMLEMLDESGEKDGSSALLSKSEIDGFILIGRMGDAFMERSLKIQNSHAGSDSFHRLPDRKKPVVLLDFYHEGYPCDAVLSNNYMGAYRITKYLTDRGHKEIGFVGTGRTSSNIMERYYGFCRCMLEQNLPIRQEWLLEDRDLETETPRIVLPPELPTAFVCGSDYTAGILYNELLARGLRVPEDISVIGYDDYLYGNSFSEKLTSYHVDMAEMAKEAVRLILRRIEFPGEPYCVCRIDSQIVERESVRDISERSLRSGAG